MEIHNDRAHALSERTRIRPLPNITESRSTASTDALGSLLAYHSIDHFLLGGGAARPRRLCPPPSCEREPFRVSERERRGNQV